MPTPTYFPQLSTGTSMQLPYSFRPAFASVLSDMGTGKRYSYAKIQAPLGYWEVNYPAITDANLATMEAIFEQQQGGFSRSRFWIRPGISLSTARTSARAHG